jgi:uncharacterized protein (TIGR02284 family)
MENVKTKTYLNDILEKTYDAQRGYKNAAENTNHVQLKKWLIQQGARRTHYAAALSSEMKNMNLEPDLDGSVKGDLHRGWLNLKLNFTAGKDETILEECLKGEHEAVDEYKDVLEHKEALPPTITSILEAQKDEIQSTVNKIKRLEDVADAKDM